MHRNQEAQDYQKRGQKQTKQRDSKQLHLQIDENEVSDRHKTVKKGSTQKSAATTAVTIRRPIVRCTDHIQHILYNTQ